MEIFTFPPNMSYSTLKSLVESLPHAYQTPHSRKHYSIEGFVDDFGDIILPGYIGMETFKSRVYYFKENSHEP